MHVTVNGEARTLADGTTINRLLDILNTPRVAIAVEVNREIVSRSRHAKHQLQDGDVIEIVTFVGGG